MYVQFKNIIKFNRAVKFLKIIKMKYHLESVK